MDHLTKLRRTRLAITATLLCCCLASAQRGPTAGERQAAARLQDAFAAAKSGDGGKALRLTKSLLASSPNYEPALKFEGALFEDMGEPQQAEATFRKALALAPQDSELMLKVGIYDLVSGDSKQAVILLNRRLKVAPHDRDALYYLAQAYHLMGDNEAALKAIKTAIKEDPQNPSLWQKHGELLCSAGDTDTALTWLNKAQNADPTLDQIEFDLAVASFNNQDLEKALKAATAAVARRPADPRALALLGSVDVKLALWDDAKSAYQRTLAVKGDDLTSLLGLGHAELELKDYQLAADSLEQVLQQDPTQVLSHFYLARAYAGLGRTEDAEREGLLHRRMLEQSASLTPGGETAEQKATLALARQLLADKKEKEALKLLSDPEAGFIVSAPAALALAGAVYVSINDVEDAVRCLNQALSLDAKVRGAHTYLGILAMQQSEFDRAEGEFNQELAAHPNDQMATAEIGEVRYRQGRWQQAADEIAQSKTAVPYLLYMLCDSYFRIDNKKEADVTAELIVDYSRGNQEMIARVVDLLRRNQQAEFAERLSSKADAR